MSKHLVLPLALIAACGMASATPLVVSVSGQFSSLDTVGPLVAPNGLFILNFLVDSNPIPMSCTVTSLGFDVPVTGFSYTLNHTAVSITPSEIRFDTLGNGGLFDVTFGSGLSATEFDFQGVQAFSGTTAAPIFSTGTYAVSSWTYSEPAGNFDSQTPASLAVSISAVPEPSSIFLALGGLAVLISAKLKRGKKI